MKSKGLAAAVIVLLPAAAHAQFNVTNPGGRVRSGHDYFARDGADPKDYATVGDRVNGGSDDVNLSAVSVSGGSLNFTTATNDGQIFMLHPGYGEVQGPLLLEAYPDERSGADLPIKASKYKILSFKITCDNCPNPNANPGLAAQATITFYKGPATPFHGSTSAAFFVYPGTNIYTYDMSTAALLVNNGTWTGGNGTVRGIRFNPANQAGRTMHVDWVTVTDPAVPSTVTFTWGTTVAMARIRLLSDNAGVQGTPIPFLRKFCTSPDVEPGSNCARALAPEDLRQPGQLTTTFTTVDVSMLAAGDYWLQPVGDTGIPIVGTVARKIRVNNVPVFTITQPDNRGAESTDFPVLYRNGDAWDFSSSTDFTIPAVRPNQFGTATIVTNPVTATAGTLAGTWMRYSNAGAEVPQDPNFVLRQGAGPTGGSPIQTPFYTNLTIRVLLDRPRDIGLGSVLRVHWSEDGTLVNLNRLNTGQDVVVHGGVQELHIDLNRLKVDPNSLGQKTWAQTVFANYLRLDPHEFPTSTNAFFDYVLLTRNDSTTNGLFTVTWQSSDVELDTRLVTVKLDPDRDPLNGNETTIANSIADVGAFAFDAATTPGLGAGSYWVLAIVNDSINGDTPRYSSGRLDVSPLPPAANVPMYRAYNPNVFYHFFTTSLAEFNNAVAAGYRDESNPPCCSIPFRVPNRPQAGASPIFRMYNPNSGLHYYTAAAGERNALMGFGWLYEKDEGFIFATQVAGSTKIFKLYNTVAGVHLYTKNAAEKDQILAAFPGIWEEHTFLGFAFP